MSLTGRDCETHTIRFPAALKEKVRAAGKLSGRSLNSEVLHRLATSFETSQTLAPAFAELLEQHIQQEVKARLSAIAAQLGNSQ